MDENSTPEPVHTELSPINDHDTISTAEKKLDLAESTCEKILFSINEECIKISQGKENGIDNDVKDNDISDLTATNIKDDEISDFTATNVKDDGISDLTATNGKVIICAIEQSKLEDSEEAVLSDEAKEDIKACLSDAMNVENIEEQQVPVPGPTLKISNDIHSKESSNDSSDKESDGKDDSGVKIKLRSFASLCSDETNGPPVTNFSSEISGVSVGDIVEHGNIIESDESGVMHLKISNVVGGEDCITGLTVEEERDSTNSFQISSVISIIEQDPSTLESSVDSARESEKDDKTSETEEQKISEELLEKTNLSEKSENIANIFKSSLKVHSTCLHCKKRLVCEFRVVIRKKQNSQTLFICTEDCKAQAELVELKDLNIQKPRLYFERICGMCGKEIVPFSEVSANPIVFSWQTREFCNKLCLADHIAEVTRSCFECKSYVRVIYMVKYCVRFGSDVHQFCSNICLEKYKLNIKVCCFCQQNLTQITCVTSQSSNKKYCSAKCLKRAQRRDISQQNYKEEHDCTVCNKNTVNKFEYIQNSARSLLCSDTCLKTFKYVSKVKTVNCCLCARLLNAEDSCNYFFNGKQLRVFCSESCFSVFVISGRKIVSCDYCKVKKYNFDMILYNSSSADFYTCSMCCLNHAENNVSSTKIVNAVGVKDVPLPELSSKDESSAMINLPRSVPVQSVIPIMKECHMCSKMESAQFHMVMSDSTLRSFCSYNCAARFKNVYGYHVSGGNLIPLENKGPVVTSVLSDSLPVVVAKDNTLLKEEKISKSVVESSKSKRKLNSKDLAGLMKIFNPPMVSNKTTMCRPKQLSKATQCKNSVSSGSQTDGTLSEDDTSDDSNVKKKPLSGIIPVPIPVYVPTPMMMFSAFTPVPLVIPFPVPFPVFIPTSEKTTKDLEERIKGIFSKFSLASKMTQLPDKENESKEVQENDTDTNSMDESECENITPNDHPLDDKELEETSEDLIVEDKILSDEESLNKQLEKDAAVVDCSSNDKQLNDPIPTSTDDSVDDPILESVDPISASVDDPISASVDDPIPDSVDDPIPDSVDDPISTSVDDPISTSVDDPISTSVDDPIPTSVDDPIPTSVDDPIPTSVDDPISASVNDSSTVTPAHLEDFADVEDEFKLITKIEAILPKFTSHIESGNHSAEPTESRKRRRDSDEGETDCPSPKRSKDLEERLNWSYGVDVWKTWAKRKLSHDPSLALEEEPMDMNSAILNNSLTLFLQDLDSQNSNMDIDTVFYLLLGIQKYIFEQGSTYCIFLELEFDEFTNEFDRMVSHITTLNQSDLLVPKQLLGTRVTEEMLWEARQLGAHTPHVLLNTLFYFNTKLFHLTNPEDHVNLKFADILNDKNKVKIRAQASVTTTGPLRYCQKTPNDKEGSESPQYLEMQGNIGNPLRCPVRLYEFYVSKCPKCIRDTGSTYYIYPEKSCLPDSSVWFSSLALRKDTIQKMLNRILLVREIQDSLLNG